ncbi:MAG: InlB B-repeat-containing protein [Syntrophobacteraceae bacterium]
MNPTKIVAALIMLAAGVLGAFLTSAQAVQYYYDYQNRLVEINLDDDTWIQYTYDANGNQTAKTYHNTDYFPITVNPGAGGTISPGSASVVYGGSQTFSIAPDTGYYLTGETVDGVALQQMVTSYTFSDVVEANTFQASFAIYTYPITTSAIGSGTISPTSATVDYGGSQTFAITPVPGTYIVGVQADGVPQGPVASYTFTDVTAGHVLSATFSQNGPVKIVRTNLCYQHLQDAYNAALTGDTILIQNVDLTESFTANSTSSISVTIEGGYTSDFSSNPGTTTITGEVTISSGTVTMGNCVISN